ncbi:MAG: ParB/RepB/Spo0J family partition protein [Lachnospiraceae bacterium]|nr:ParB/RepB/Spo0J family partition protein [Lachnospiraceae bacterium]
MQDKPNIQFKSYDDMFGVGTGDTSGAEAVEIRLEELHEFEDHPFSVRDDAAMAELADSIREQGVIVPAIVRPRKEGGYELIAGHRRRRASQLAGKETMPVVIKDIPDDIAIAYMVDSNIQREGILPSEKAKAYAMRAKVISVEDKGRTDEKLAAEFGESRNQIRRYMHLNQLSKAMLDLIDAKRMPVNVGYELSFLCPVSQSRVFVVMMDHNVVPSIAQAQKIKEVERQSRFALEEEQILEILIRKTSAPKRRFTMNEKRINQYFPENYTPEDIEKTIIDLLDRWKEGAKE